MHQLQREPKVQREHERIFAVCPVESIRAEARRCGVVPKRAPAPDPRKRARKKGRVSGGGGRSGKAIEVPGANTGARVSMPGAKASADDASSSTAVLPPSVKGGVRSLKHICPQMQRRGKLHPGQAHRRLPGEEIAHSPGFARQDQVPSAPTIHERHAKHEVGQPPRQRRSHHAIASRTHERLTAAA